MKEVAVVAVGCIFAVLGLSLALYARRVLRWWGQDHLWIRETNKKLGRLLKMDNGEPVPKLPVSQTFWVLVEWYLRTSGILLAAASAYVLYVVVSGWLNR